MTSSISDPTKLNIKNIFENIWNKIYEIETRISEDGEAIQQRFKTLESRVNARCVADRIMQERLEVLEKKIN